MDDIEHIIMRKECPNCGNEKLILTSDGDLQLRKIKFFCNQCLLLVNWPKERSVCLGA